MKKFRGFVFLLVLLTLLSQACRGQGRTPQSQADLWIVTGTNAARVLGNGADGMLLSQWAKANDVNIYVQKTSGPEASNLRELALETGEGPDVFVFDDGLFADGLYNSKSIAQSAVGLWVENNVANTIGLTGNTISFDQYVDHLSTGKLATAAGNALSSSASSEHFFAILAWCSNTDSSNLTIEIVKDQAVRDCGKTVYENIKTNASTTDAIQMVYDGVVSRQANAYNSVIAYDSSFLGKGGKNESMIEEAGTFMRFFYFEEATPVSVMTFGSKDLADDKNKSTLVKNLGEFLVGDEAQKAFNLAGLGSGASTLSIPDESAFVAEWGVTMYPSAIVNVINPPVPAVAFEALQVYAEFYKRQKEINICIDTSGSTERSDDHVSPRLQHIARAIKTFTNPEWQKSNLIVLGRSDRITYRMFATTVTPILAESVGTDTKPAGDYITGLIGPVDGPYDFRGNERKVQQIVPGYVFSDTAMFDCADNARLDIESRYSPNVDYYIVILTDGEQTAGIEFDQFKENWQNAGHGNISILGIQFGNAGPDVSEENMSQLNGKHYDGVNADQLISAFKDIFGN